MQEIAKLKKEPHEIALGFAIGVFIGLLPTPGFNILLGLLAIFVYKQLNKLAVFGGMALFNPLTTPFTLYAANVVGRFFVDPLDPTDPLYTLVRGFLNTTFRIAIGSLIIATISSVVAYFMVKQLARRFQEKE